MKLTKKDLESLVVFNRNQKRIGEPKMSPEQYLRYLYGKTEKIIQGKPKRLKSIDIPVWAISHKDIPSVTSNHIATKPNQEYKKEVSKNYTISIPFNKGSYSVIPVSEIHCIGKK
nr:MAG: hypothetical protein [Caudoviricetes sp.]